MKFNFEYNRSFAYLMFFRSFSQSLFQKILFLINKRIKEFTECKSIKKKNPLSDANKSRWEIDTVANNVYRMRPKWKTIYRYGLVEPTTTTKSTKQIILKVHINRNKFNFK